MTFSVAPARSPDEIAACKGLFHAYAASLDVDLAYQGFAAELEGLPGPYSSPRGELLIARDFNRAPVGCVAWRALAGATCEMKRLFVAPEARGHGLGEALVAAVLQTAAAAGYRELKLDTLPSMRSAQEIYRRFGFEVTPPYYSSPIPGTVFMRLRLPDGGPGADATLRQQGLSSRIMMPKGG